MITEPQKDVFIMGDVTDKIKAGFGNGRGTFLLALLGIAVEERRLGRTGVELLEKQAVGSLGIEGSVH